MALLRLLLFFPLILIAEDLSDSRELLQLLSSNDNWVTNEVTKDGITIKMKNVEGSSLHALMVTKPQPYNVNEIALIVYDVANYGNVLTSATGLTTTVLKSEPDYLDAYQYISVPIPFFNDRNYCFSMTMKDLSDLHKGGLVIWELLEKSGNYHDFIESNDKGAQYLDFGAGIWIAEDTNEGIPEVSYRLFMDIGGSVPKFITEMVNKVTIVDIYRDVIKEAERRESKQFD